MEDSNEIIVLNINLEGFKRQKWKNLILTGANVSVNSEEFLKDFIGIKKEGKRFESI